MCIISNESEKCDQLSFADIAMMTIDCPSYLFWFSNWTQSLCSEQTYSWHILETFNGWWIGFL